MTIIPPEKLLASNLPKKDLKGFQKWFCREVG
jgi:hypothetical protein